MNKQTLNKSLIYDELGLSPIWVKIEKNKEVKDDKLLDNSSLFYLKKIKLDSHDVAFIAPIFNSSNTSELELFKKISIYLDTLSDKSSQISPLKVIQEPEIIIEIESCKHLILLESGLDKKIEKKNLNIPYLLSVSLKEMIENPEKKRKLWQDIKELLISTK